MIAVQSHRGPDGRGQWSDGKVTLCHNLLAITDTPDAGRQPFIVDDRYVLIYNGEIYNYQALKEDLARLGYRFQTRGDTEVLARGLAHFGTDFVGRLNGMFAFAFYDLQRGTLLLARDPMGMKPLYWCLANGRLFWGSEIRALLELDRPRRLDAGMMGVFLELGYVPGHRTLVDGIQKLMPGQLLTMRLGDRPELSFFAPPASATKREGFDASRLRLLMGASSKDHTMGLRPFGMYLSGGLDSSIVLTELLSAGIRHLATYTTRFADADERFNEDADIATRMARDLGADHHELTIGPADFTDAIEPTIATIEEPRYHPSLPAYWLMARRASKDVVVILTGDGGDESWLGYPKYLESRRISGRYRRQPRILLNAYYSLTNWYKGKTPPLWLDLADPVVRWWYLARIIDRRHAPIYRVRWSSADTMTYLRSLKHPAILHPDSDPENAQAELDRLFWLAEDSFIMTDKIGMHWGMEARFPMADRRLVEYAAGISSNEKLLRGPKTLVRQAYDGVLPGYVLRKRKTGWTAPIGQWMTGKLGEYMREVMTPGWYDATRGMFDLSKLSSNYLGGRAAGSTKPFFTVFSFQLWARHFKITS